MFFGIHRRGILSSLCAFYALIGFGCGGPTPDLGSPDGKQQILDEVDALLNSGDCADAVAAIQPLYASASSDNNVRMHAASAYACYTGLKLISLSDQIAQNSGQIATGSGFWELMSQLFPSTSGKDYVEEGALLATDALLAMLQPGALVLPANQINPGTNNVGSPFPGDRTTDANLYTLFVSMSAIGAVENRFGKPNLATHKKTVNLSFDTAATMTMDGCALASATLNLVDALGAVQNVLPASTQGGLSTVQGLFSIPLNLACEYGCNGATPPALAPLNPPPGNWAASGCSFPAGTCSQCPSELRDRTRCKLSANDKATCAAAGIINFINVSSLGWQ